MKDFEKNFELYENEAKEISEPETYWWFVKRGLSPDVAVRLAELVGYVKRVGKKIYEIGKVLVKKIMDFVEAHPYVIIGALVGAALSALIKMIPVLGWLLGPIANMVLIPLGIVSGYLLEKNHKKGGIIGLVQELIEIAHETFKLVAEAVRGLFRKEACHV